MKIQENDLIIIHSEFDEDGIISCIGQIHHKIAETELYDVVITAVLPDNEISWIDIKKHVFIKKDKIVKVINKMNFELFKEKHPEYFI
jgi:hypothetical protein